MCLGRDLPSEFSVRGQNGVGAGVLTENQVFRRNRLPEHSNLFYPASVATTLELESANRQVESALLAHQIFMPYE
jgi:hypothetical protein